MNWAHDRRLHQLGISLVFFYEKLWLGNLFFSFLRSNTKLGQQSCFSYSVIKHPETSVVFISIIRKYQSANLLYIVSTLFIYDHRT